MGVGRHEADTFQISATLGASRWDGRFLLSVHTVEI